MIIVLNSAMTRLGVIKNTITATRMEALNGENTLEFDAILDKKVNDFVNENTVFELNDDYFDIAKFEKHANEDGTYTVAVEAEHISYRLNNPDYDKKYFTEMGTPYFILEKILQDTGFDIGSIEFDTTMTYSAQEPKSRRQLLMEFVALLEGEVIFDKFLVSIVLKRGSAKVKPAIKDRNIKVMSKAVDKRSLDEQGNFLISYICTPIYLPSEDYNIGDNVQLLQKELGISEQLRVVSIARNPYDSLDTTIQFANYKNGLESSLYRVVTQAVVKDKLYNGCRIGPEFGFEAVRNDKMARAYFRSDGLVLQSGDGSGGNWKDRLYYSYNSDTDESTLIYDGKLSTEVLEAVSAYVGKLDVEIAKITEAVINQLNVGQLVTDTFQAQEANIVNAVIEQLDVKQIATDTIKAEEANIVKAVVGQLNVEQIVTDTIKAEEANITDAVVINLTTDNFIVKQLEANTAAIVDLLAGEIRVNELRTSGAKHLHIKRESIKFYDIEDEDAYGARAEFGFATMEDNNVPVLVFGAGDGSGGSRGLIYKDVNSMQVGYIRGGGLGESSISFGERIVIIDGYNRYVLDLADGQDGWSLVKNGNGIAFAPVGGAVDFGNANLVILNHTPTEQEAAGDNGEALYVVYDIYDTTARWGSDAFDVAANMGFKGTRQQYDGALSQVGNMEQVLDLLLAEGN